MLRRDDDGAGKELLMAPDLHFGPADHPQQPNCGTPMRRKPRHGPSARPQKEPATKDQKQHPVYIENGVK